MPGGRTWRREAGLLLALALCGAVTARAAGVRVAVSPPTLTVAAGDTFTVQLQVPVAGDAFNTFDAIVAYDPAVLKFVSRPQSAQEGPLLVDSCSTKSTFYLFTGAGDSLTVADGMLGAGCSTVGPGTLLSLRFVALAPPGVAYVRLRRVHFYNDGFPVLPVTSSDATVAVGVVLSVSGPSAAAARLRAVPNPSRGTCWLGPIPHPDGATELLVVDAAGRLVRRIALDPGAPGAPVAWDGRNSAGQVVPPGVYSLVSRGSVHPVKATLIRLP